MICALPALWVGLIYEPQAQAEALQLISSWTQEDRDYLRTGGTGGLEHLVGRCWRLLQCWDVCGGVKDARGGGGGGGGGWACELKLEHLGWCWWVLVRLGWVWVTVQLGGNSVRSVSNKLR